MKPEPRSVFSPWRAALALPFLVAACASSSTPTPDAGPPPDGGGGGPGLRARRLELAATEYHLDPSQFFAEPGEPLVIALRNAGTMDHSLAFELGTTSHPSLGQNVPPGSSLDLAFTAPTTPGDYPYFCPIDNHRGLGMEGKMTVAPAPVVGVTEVASGFTHPVALVAPPDGSGRLFVVDQIGLVKIVTREGTLLPTPFLDVRSKLPALKPAYDERGLLGLAFHPQYKQNGRLFVYYTAPLRAGAPASFDNTSTVAEFHVAPGDANRADVGTERIVFQVDHPQANHNGGFFAFSPKDAFLYLAIGDGGGGGDIDPGHTPVLGNAQDVTKVLGKVLRFDVDHATPYAIPPDNPFAHGGGAPEIYAWGLRNPYSGSFDMGGQHDLFIGDAGQDLWEEVDRVTLGGNYGWHILEGTHCFNTKDFTHALPSCAHVGAHGEPLIPPILEQPNATQHAGVSVVMVGGRVYRGAALPGMLGRYLFGTWTQTAGQPQGVLFMGIPNTPASDLWSYRRVRIAGSTDGTLGHYLLSFGQDEAGEVYVLVTDMAGPSGTTGRVLKLIPSSGS